MHLILVILASLISIARADYLTVYAIPSPYGISWKSPAALAASTVKNQMAFSVFKTQHNIGHSVVELQCGTEAPDFAGVTGASFLESLDVLDQQGLGILFHSFKGRLQNRPEIEADLRSQMKAGTISWIRFLVRPQTCARLVSFLTDFRRIGQYAVPYGLNLAPRKREGAGCTSFAIAFVELAGLMTPTWRNQWLRMVRVPEQLIGNPENPVSLTSIFSAKTWAPPHRPHRLIEFWDPDLMFQSFTDLAQNSRYPKIRIEQSVGVDIDARQFPTPVDSIWKQNSLRFKRSEQLH